MLNTSPLTHTTYHSTMSDYTPKQSESEPQITQPSKDPSIPPRIGPEPHPNWIKTIFEQLRDQHTDLRTTILEASAVFKSEEAKLQEVLTSVRKVVGPQVAKQIDEDVAASMKAGKLVCGDPSVLDAGLSNHPVDDGDGTPKSKRTDGGKRATRSKRNSKGKRKAKATDNNSQAGDQGGANDDIQASGPGTRSKKRPAETQLDENADRQKQSKNLPAISPKSSRAVLGASVAPEKPRLSLKRSREKMEDESEEEVEKSVTISSVLSGPVAKKSRHQGGDVTRDTPGITPLSSTSSGTDSQRTPNPTGTTDNHAGPPASSHPEPSTNRLFPPSAFPRVRPPAPPPKRPQARFIRRPLKRDTTRIRTNPDTGELEIYDYETTPEYIEREERNRYNHYLQASMTYDPGDFRAMMEFDCPRFKFDRYAWKEFEN